MNESPINWQKYDADRNTIVYVSKIHLVKPNDSNRVLCGTLIPNEVNGITIDSWHADENCNKCFSISDKT